MLVTQDSRASDLNGFLREKGRGDVALSFTWERYEKFWVGDTRVQDPGVGNVTTRSLSLWFAYGLTDRFTVIGDIPLIDTKGDGLGGFEERDIQDLTLLLAGRIVSFGDRVRSELIGAAGVRSDPFGYEANMPVDVGDGTDDWLFRVVYQLRWRQFYFSQQVGYDLRDNDAPDGLPFYTEIGQTWGPVTATGYCSKYIANGGTDIGDPGFTFPSNGDEFLRFGARVYGKVTDHFGLAGGLFRTRTGRNTGDTNGYSGGVVVSF
ncbi:MAG TPA: hypothetical protein VGK94_07155 [Candidatus Polarisedimenticolia bacterium]|jgi:hypothetical protein